MWMYRPGGSATLNINEASLTPSPVPHLSPPQESTIFGSYILTYHNIWYLVGPLFSASGREEIDTDKGIEHCAWYGPKLTKINSYYLSVFAQFE